MAIRTRGRPAEHVQEREAIGQRSAHDDVLELDAAARFGAYVHGAAADFADRAAETALKASRQPASARATVL